MNKVKFNGPNRHNNCKYLSEDLKMLRVVLKQSNNNNTSNNYAMTSADLIDQLPNTVSVSFESVLGHDLVSALGTQVSA